jgi:hypothetical protein
LSVELGRKPGKIEGISGYGDNLLEIRDLLAERGGFEPPIQLLVV